MGGVLWKANTVPGPTKLIGGNLQAGFYGEVPTSEFITGDELARMVGLTSGTSQYSNEPWLKFSYLGKIEFISKKTFRYNFPCDDLVNKHLVYGDRIIKINDNNYKIRLIKGKTEGKQNDTTHNFGSIYHNSEWNRLILPIHKNAPDKWESKYNVSSSTDMVSWNINYTSRDLNLLEEKDSLTYRPFLFGYSTYCQELYESADGVFRTARGFGTDPSEATDMITVIGLDDGGWRPVLELIDE